MAPIAGEQFPKTARLRKRAQFIKLSRTGGKFQAAHFVVISEASDAMESRLGITVSGKVGNSVVRNRIKRLIREFFRRHRSVLPRSTDFLVIARPSAATLPGKVIAAELERAMIPQRDRHTL